MESLAWRVKRLEEKLMGYHRGVGAEYPQEKVVDKLEEVAKDIDKSSIDFKRFNQMHDNLPSPDISDSTKAELVLAYEDDLVKHVQDLKILAEKADKVLDNSKWPDLTKVEKQLENLTKITKEQHLESISIDSNTEGLIKIYNDILTSFKSNMATWNSKLEAHESQERRMDED